MSLHAAILTALAILGIALLGVWQSAPSVFAEARGLMDGERLDMLVARRHLGACCDRHADDRRGRGEPDPERADRVQPCANSGA